jgi:hypothetical protein
MAYTVTHTGAASIPYQKIVIASYFKEDGSLTIFKDEDNQAVYAIQTSSLVSIERS